MRKDKEAGIAINFKELEPGNVIKVEKNRVVGANQFGRPIVETAGHKAFTDFEEALDWSLKSPEYAHAFTIPLSGLNLSASLFGEKREANETLKITYKDKTGESPRTVENHHAVSTDYECFFNLVIKLEHNQTILFDRGVVWINLQNKSMVPNLTFSINAGVHTKEELKEGVLQMASRIDSVLNDLAAGQI